MSYKSTVKLHDELQRVTKQSMNLQRNFIFALPVAALLLCAATAGEESAVPAREVDGQRPVLIARLEEQTISPGTARYVDRALREADRRNAACLVVVLDTPGGLLTSTRRIVKRFLASETPVVVYVSPAGSRAASAGVFITLSAHVAAMAPGTTIGAAHPVQIGTLPTSPQPPSPGESPTDSGDGASDGQSADGRSPMEEKIINDTVAWARALAKQRGRNADWVASAVEESVSVSASEALEKDVIDVVAEDMDDLLNQIDGRTVNLPSGSATLQTADAPREAVPMWWGETLLAIIAHPNVAFLLLMFGFYGILFELYNPGWGVPGTLGVVCMLLGLFGLSVLPVNYLGVALVLVALGMFVAELFVTSYGALAAAGTACLVLGGIMLVDSPTGFTRVSWSVLLPIAGATALIVLCLVAGIVRTHRGQVKTGGEGLIGLAGRAAADFTPQNDHYRGTVKLHGERWRSLCDAPLKAGQACRVVDREGLTLTVEPAEETSAGEDKNH